MPVYRFEYNRPKNDTHGSGTATHIEDVEARDLDQAYQQLLKRERYTFFYECFRKLIHHADNSDMVTQTVNSLDCRWSHAAIYSKFKAYPDFIIKAFFEEAAKLDCVTIGLKEEKPAYGTAHGNMAGPAYDHLECQVAWPTTIRNSNDFRIIYYKDSRNVIAVVDTGRKPLDSTPEIEEFCKKHQFFITEETFEHGLTLIPITSGNLMYGTFYSFGAGALIENERKPRRFVVKIVYDKCKIIGVVNSDGVKIDFIESDIRRAKKFKFDIDA